MYNKYINEINGETTNKYIVNEYGEIIFHNFGFEDCWNEINEEIEKIYNLCFEILEDPTGQLYYNFL